eukprot:3417098-Pyramimonas_sp.AAC.1
MSCKRQTRITHFCSLLHTAGQAGKRHLLPPPAQRRGQKQMGAIYGACRRQVVREQRHAAPSRQPSPRWIDGWIDG